MKQGFDLVSSWTSGHGRYLLHTNGQRHSKQVKKSCLASKDEFYVGAAAHDDWISLFESHLAQHGRISYNYKHTQSKLLCFDLVM